MTSLNNHDEYVSHLKKGAIPNEETMKAIEDARQDRVEPIDNLDRWLDEL